MNRILHCQRSRFVTRRWEAVRRRKRLVGIQELKTCVERSIGFFVAPFHAHLNCDIGGHGSEAAADGNDGTGIERRDERNADAGFGSINEVARDPLGPAHVVFGFDPNDTRIARLTARFSPFSSEFCRHNSALPVHRPFRGETLLVLIPLIFTAIHLRLQAGAHDVHKSLVARLSA